MENNLLQIFRIALGKGVIPEERDSLLKQALAVLESTEHPFALRKLAAQVLYRIRGSFSEQELGNPAVLTALYEESSVEKFVPLLRHYVMRIEDKGLLLNDSTLSLFTCISQKCAKYKKKILEIIGQEELKHIGLVLIDECMKFCDHRSEDLSHLVKTSLKFCATDVTDFDEIFDYISLEYPSSFHPKYLLLALIIPNLSNIKLSSSLPSLCDELLRCANSQVGCGAVAPTVLSLANNLSDSKEFENMVFKALTSENSASRVNSSRYWAGRMLGQPKLRPLLIRIIQRCEMELERTEELWPPKTASAWEEVCCVSANWTWDEAEEVVWLRDALIHAAISLAFGLSSGQTNKHSGYLSGGLLKSALRWHSTSIRLLAFHLLKVVGEKNFLLRIDDSEIDVKTELSSFILRNLNCDNGDLHSAILESTKEIIWSDQDIQRFSTILLRENSSEEAVMVAISVLRNNKETEAFWQLTKSFSDPIRRRAISILKKNNDTDLLESTCEDVLSKDGLHSDRSLDLLEWSFSVFGNDKVWQMVKSIKGDDELGFVSFLCRFISWGGEIENSQITDSTQRCEDLLSISGSHHLNECPTFPILYSNLDNAGMSQKRFADLILRNLQFLCACVKGTLLSASKCLDVVFQVTMRCRHKAVVDNGTALLPQLIKGTSLAEGLFNKTLSLLLSDAAQSRTLSLSKTLHTCCEEQPELFEIFWKAVKNCLVGDDSASIVQIRAFKSLKYFLVRENCPIATSSNIEWLFIRCIDIQKSNAEFLVKSAATNLYGFVVSLLLSRRHSLPLFVLIGNRFEFWKIVQRTAEELPNSSPVCRVLFLSFLSKILLGSKRLYSENQLSQISALRSHLISLLSIIGDARERRYAIECIVGLIPNSEKEEVFKKVKDSYAECETWVQRQTIGYLQYCLNGYKEIELPSSSSSKSIPTDILSRPFVALIERVRGTVDDDDESELESLLNEMSTSLNLAHELPSNAYAYALALMGERIIREGTSFDLRSLWVSTLRTVLSGGGRSAAIAARALTLMGITSDFLQPEAALEALDNYLAANS